jgi:hypothetical protein
MLSRKEKIEDTEIEELGHSGKNIWNIKQYRTKQRVSKTALQ